MIIISIWGVLRDSCTVQVLKAPVIKKKKKKKKSIRPNVWHQLSLISLTVMCDICRKSVISVVNPPKTAFVMGAFKDDVFVMYYSPSGTINKNNR